MKDGTGLEDLLRDAAPQVLAALLRRFRDFDAAEDAVQEALAGRRDAVAGRWPSRLAARLVDPGRLSSSHRSHPHRDGAATAAGRHRVGGATRGTGAAGRSAAGRSRRHARAAVHVLSPGALAGVGHGAHAACGRRPHHRRDRRRVHGAGSDDGAAHQPGEAVDQDVRRAVPSADESRVARAARGRDARALSDLQRRLRIEQRRGARANRPVERRHPPDACAPSLGAGRRRNHGAAGADAAHRRATPRARERTRRSGAARRAGSRDMERDR